MHRLVRVLAALIIVSALATGSGVAHDSEYSVSEHDIEALNDKIESYDGIGTSVARSQVGGETVNVVVTHSGEENSHYSATVSESLQVTEVRETHREDATVKVSVSMATIDEIAASERPAQTAYTAYTDDRVTVEAISDDTATQLKVKVSESLKQRVPSERPETGDVQNIVRDVADNVGDIANLPPMSF